MRAKNYWQTTALLLVSGLVIGCNRSGDKSASTERTGSSPAAASQFNTPFQDESQFIVATIVSDLAEQVFYAKHHQLPDPKYFLARVVEKPGSSLGAPVYNVEITFKSNQPEVRTELKIDGPIWSPEIYKSIAAVLAKEVGLEARDAASADSLDMLQTLTEGGGRVIERENQKLSEELEADFKDPVLHEKAAALLGAFALRDHSGDFFEIHLPLCRMTAHLAVAQLLAGEKPMGVNGQIAEAMLYTLMNNETTALDKLEKIKSDSGVTGKWSATLRAYATGDYRPLSELQDLPLIERIARFHAFARSVSVNVAWDQLADSEKTTPDFVRIASEEGYSVETGHQLLALSLPLEFREIAAVYELSRGQKWKTKEMIEQLNEMPERCFGPTGHVRVIGWGQWANFFQKLVCHAVRHNYDFMENKWGVPDDARTFLAECDQTFARLRYYPFVRALTSKQAQSHHVAVDDCSRVIDATPELVPGTCWLRLFSPGGFATSRPLNVMTWMHWYQHDFPAGTAYDSALHLDQFSFGLPTNSPTLARRALHELAPYDRQISDRIFRYEYGAHPTYEQAETLYQAVLPFATYAMVRLARTVENQPERFEMLMARAAGLNPSGYFELGDYVKNHQQDDKAADYFEKGCKLGPDSVKASYYASWLIKYYLKKGDVEKAQSVADTAGAVYSSVGLEAKAEFFEATGKYNEAFEWYSKVAERYDDAGPVESFCMRYKAKTGDTRFDSYLQQRVTKLFPHGMEHVSLASFVDAPADGVLVAEQNNLVHAAGLKTGDVIVAVYGIRVHNFPQYSNARESTSESELDLIVWQDNNYREIKFNLPGHRFGVQFDSYRSQ